MISRIKALLEKFISWVTPSLPENYLGKTTSLTSLAFLLALIIAIILIHFVLGVKPTY